MSDPETLVTIGRTRGEVEEWQVVNCMSKLPLPMRWYLYCTVDPSSRILRYTNILHSVAFNLRNLLPDRCQHPTRYESRELYNLEVESKALPRPH